MCTTRGNCVHRGAITCQRATGTKGDAPAGMRPGHHRRVHRDISRTARAGNENEAAGNDRRRGRPSAADGPGGPGARASCWVWEMTLPAAGHAPGVARQATREVLASRHAAHVEETAVLFVSELVTNAVRHAAAGGSMLVLRLEAAASLAEDRGPRPRPAVAAAGASRPGSTSQDSDSSSWMPWPPTGESAARPRARPSGPSWRCSDPAPRAQEHGGRPADRDYALLSDCRSAALVSRDVPEEP